MRRRGQELLGILLVCAGLLLAVACLSFDAGDPSYNNAAPGAAENLLGLAGATGVSADRPSKQ